jgi:hypothetical protein
MATLRMSLAQSTGWLDRKVVGGQGLVVSGQWSVISGQSYQQSNRDTGADD